MLFFPSTNIKNMMQDIGFTVRFIYYKLIVKLSRTHRMSEAVCISMWRSGLINIALFDQCCVSVRGWFSTLQTLSGSVFLPSRVPHIACREELNLLSKKKKKKEKQLNIWISLQDCWVSVRICCSLLLQTADQLKSHIPNDALYTIYTSYYTYLLHISSIHLYTIHCQYTLFTLYTMHLYTIHLCSIHYTLTVYTLHYTQYLCTTYL